MKKQKEKLELINNEINEFRETLIPWILILIPIVFILYLINVHYIINTIFRLDLFYKFFLYILIPMELFSRIYNKEKIKLEDIFLLIFLIFTIISTIYAYDTQIALIGFWSRYEGLYSILFYIFLYFNAKRINSDQKCIKIILITILVNFIVGITQKTGLFVLVFTKFDSKNMLGLTENSNFFGSLMGMLTILPLMFYYFNNSKKRFIYLIILILGYIALLSSNSTGSFLAFILTIILMIIFFVIKKQINLKKILTILLIIILLYPVVLHNNNEITPEIKSHIKFITKNEASKGTYNIKNNRDLGHGRIRIWSNVWNLIKEKPLLGYGPDNLGLVYKKSSDDSKIADKAHNIYLNIWVSSGIFALIGYLGWIIVSILKNIKTKNKITLIVLFAVISYAISALVSISVIEVTPYFFVLMALLTKKTKDVF